MVIITNELIVTTYPLFPLYVDVVFLLSINKGDNKITEKTEGSIKYNPDTQDTEYRQKTKTQHRKLQS
jgi:hypothetical protein